MITVIYAKEINLYDKLWDKGVKQFEGECCPLHGDVCECSEDTKRGFWRRSQISSNRKI